MRQGLEFPVNFVHPDTFMRRLMYYYRASRYSLTCGENR